MSRVRRSKLEIIISILHAARENVNATHITYRANLSYSQLQSYLKLLIKNGLISIIDDAEGNRSYRTTPKGQLLIDHWEKVKDLLFM